MTTLFKVRSGSHLYGTNTPESDEDFIEVYLYEPKWYLGLNAVSDPKGRMTKSGNTDVTRFEFRHFLRLCLAYNPNVVEVLHSPELAVQADTVGRALYDHRNKFLSHRSLTALRGYCHQMRLDVMDPTRTGQQGTKRKALVDRFGYDVKAAAHAWRLASVASVLASTGIHIADLRSNVISVDTARAIRAGEWTREQVLGSITELLTFSTDSRVLPDEPDHEWVDDFCVKVLRGHTS